MAPDDGALLDAAVAVFDEGLGPGYVTADDLRALARSNRPEAGVFVALAGDEVAGAGTVDRSSPALVARVRDLGVAAGHALPELSERTTGHLRTGAVRPHLRRRGFGGALMTTRLDLLRDAGCTAVIALAWVSGDRDNSQRLLRAHGFGLVAEIPDYWRAEPDPGAPACPVCGAVCRCTAAVHVALW